MDMFCIAPFMLFLIIVSFLYKKQPSQMTDEEMMDEVMEMEIMDDESWDEPW